MRLMSTLLRVHTLLALGPAEHFMAEDENVAYLLLEEERERERDKISIMFIEAVFIMV